MRRPVEFGYFSQAFDFLNKPTEFSLRIAVPIGRPHAVDSPIQLLENALPQAISIASGL